MALKNHPACVSDFHLRIEAIYFLVNGPVQNPAFLPCLSVLHVYAQVNVRRKTLQIAKIRRFQLQERQHTTDNCQALL